MTHCAGCLPLRGKLSPYRIPTCLEPIVFAATANRSRRVSDHPSYQCLACQRIWVRDADRGYQSEIRYGQAA